ncbi:TlpA family protein disulfide reductase [Streptomyces millisiae]|uniref:TlpA disulfide reductase family protein n=1 Tax=Streptomyces millisiae TaxID=3075542 RepID=A0ABU2LV07_9ACTN|nr:TlpA disulfide reductase family protein [Streptomyces sp. DSM 44918]MDT0321093.1 TlpA disulfide reductase family protein [Streptomyces sp. DSM 44918]
MIQNRAFGRVARGAAAALAGALLLGACGGEDNGGSTSGDGTNYVEGTGEITQVAVAERDQAPDLVGENLEGEELRLADYRGQVVVLNVWGSWCAPCRAEAPHLVAAAEETADQGVAFLGLNTRDLTTDNALAFERRYEVDYPSFYDPNGRLIGEFPNGTLNPQFIPSTLIIDREGRIAARALTALSKDQLLAALEPVIAEE